MISNDFNCVSPRKLVGQTRSQIRLAATPPEARDGLSFRERGLAERTSEGIYMIVLKVYEYHASCTTDLAYRLCGRK